MWFAGPAIEVMKHNLKADLDRRLGLPPMVLGGATQLVADDEQSRDQSKLEHGLSGR